MPDCEFHAAIAADSGGDRTAGDCGIVDSAAISWLERGHQHIGFAFLFARHLFPAIAYERAQVPGYRAGGSSLPRDDFDFRLADGGLPGAGLSDCVFGDESLQHGPLDRVDGPGTSAALSGAKWIRGAHEAEIRR